MDRTQAIKEIAILLFILMPLIILAALLNPTLIYFPISGYYMALFTMTMAVLMYAFASFDFQYIQKHAKPWISAGSAETEKMGELTIFYLGTQLPTSKKVIVNLHLLPKKTRFLGRWTVYTSKYRNSRIEYWLDHPIFGDNWFYILYK